MSLPNPIRKFLVLIPCIVGFPAFAMDCETMDAADVSDSIIFDRATGYFPVSPSEVYYCGEAGFSSLYKAEWNDYETVDGWEKSAEIQCWSDEPRRPDTIYNCSRSITNRHPDSGLSINSAHDLPINVIASVVKTVALRLMAGEAIYSINYVPVKCGGGWSVAQYGFGVALRRETASDTIRSFIVTKDCSPTPCVWEAELKVSPAPIH